MLKFKWALLASTMAISLGLCSSSVASTATIAIKKGKACGLSALKLAAQETAVLKGYITADPDYIGGAISSTLTYPYGVSDGSGSNKVVFGKAANNKFYSWVSLGSSCGCYSNMTLVGELRAGSTAVTSPSNLNTESLYMATALCPLVLSTANNKYTLVSSTNTIKCTNDNNTTYHAKTIHSDNSYVKNITSAVDASSLCTSAAATEIAQ